MKRTIQQGRLLFGIAIAPRVVIAFRSHDPNAQNEWSSGFIALAMCGGCWICALRASRPGNVDKTPMVRFEMVRMEID
jgi:hypothetical protein